LGRIVVTSLRKELEAPTGIRGLLGRGKRRISRSVRKGLRNYRERIEGLIDQRRLKSEIDKLRSSADLAKPLPDFLIIGAPKCATSWLGAALTPQSNILMVKDEIEYFTSHLDRPLDWYVARFEGLLATSDKPKRLAPGEKLFLGEKSAGYCGLSPARIRLVHRLLPDARLILMIRDPVARHWSHAKRYFSKAKAQRRGFKSLDSRQQLERFFRQTRHYSEFSKMIENWTNVYPAKSLLIVSQEAALADPAATFERVIRHIGAEGVGARRMKHALRSDRNRGPQVSMPPEVARYLERMFAGERKRLERVLHARFPGDPTAAINMPQARP
jgi:hypothetical protein